MLHYERLLYYGSIVSIKIGTEIVVPSEQIGFLMKLKVIIMTMNVTGSIFKILKFILSKLGIVYYISGAYNNKVLICRLRTKSY